MVEDIEPDTFIDAVMQDLKRLAESHNLQASWARVSAMRGATRKR
jgi:hypothetical protein